MSKKLHQKQIYKLNYVKSKFFVSDLAEEFKMARFKYEAQYGFKLQNHEI